MYNTSPDHTIQKNTLNVQKPFFSVNKPMNTGAS